MYATRAPTGPRYTIQLPASRTSAPGSARVHSNDMEYPSLFVLGIVAGFLLEFALSVFARGFARVFARVLARVRGVNIAGQNTMYWGAAGARTMYVNIILHSKDAAVKRGVKDKIEEKIGKGPFGKGYLGLSR